MNIGKPYEELVQVATTMQATLKRLQKEAEKKGSLKDLGGPEREGPVIRSTFFKGGA